ncbi:MAG: hypothetical protein UY31_C0056G0003 [Candidatus Wolfebacteria bacterium GW2011_GWE1_48_7]|uniref:DUF5666 domain-containing protein n=2 Tax=Candidatus Wolfeibacteriota TaxID=1752735 RepID=A0A0G1WGJ9_9BACT|nr:MAG: hypothetical protein UX70_C0001G0597 [Candidatus Wolfebacteria bacterium GW2011_GWB1_47_1]KKU36864.1 MAG: hypothetical protein UX49_C0007G0023 [Candidatus Wolfebacteria bacterium GW2011_GWC2_46_275]KKU42473.1 MAG: hypothetical protein UX58_C0002G0187 [Candidatus Wolfebacteria bacterium GW2011_GWB2_46_69]KKU54258.1 MAG: hypothetical protein UX76_C0004G0062 [Candidatus Wolfebacteria bacterium GW2011_GWC1_47_103]KKU59626.1 MAG: hypothetical protein UX83_C0003G0041 [Candidatus Wolfebacteria
MTKQLISKCIPVIVASIIVGTGSFYAGMRYERSNTNNPQQNESFANMTQEQRQARMVNGGFAGTQRASGTTRTNNGGLIAGEILSKDAASITIKLRDGGSRIVFLSDATKVMKSIDGSLADLTTGTQVTTIGTANADGSIMAQSIQLRTDTSR